jgi:4'-phosphopantetheinyl transferase
LSTALIDINSNEIHLWFAKVPALSRSAVEAYTKLLSAAEQHHCEKLLFERNRHEYLITRALVRTTLSRYLPVKPEDWQFAQGPFGKPKVEPSCGLQFNLSNTPGLTACLVSSCGEVGVDIEPWGRARDIVEIAHTVFSPSELDALYALPPESQNERVLSLWTLKESYVKAKGTGLNFPLKNFSFLFNHSSVSRLIFDAQIDDNPERWKFGIWDYEKHRVAIMAQSSASLRLSVLQSEPLTQKTATLFDSILL